MISYKLFIEGEELVLNEDVQVAITKQFEDVSNPTTVINDWSKTVNIPMCSTNNKIFGHLYDPKKAIVASSDPNQKLTGVYFDPTKKLNFRLEYGSAVIMVGYAKMNSVTKQRGKGTYNLTLNGELGKIFQIMNKITFDTNSEESDYIIDGSKYVESNINKELVYDSWNSTGQSNYLISPSCTINDYIGFAPNNTYYEEFDPKSYQSSSNTATQFTETLKSQWDDGNGGYVTGIDPGTAIPDGMLPRDIGEFRSYYQTPYIYWNKLWQIFQAKSESLTGYKWSLDSSWFNEYNPYYSKLIYMLKPFNVKDGTNLENHYTRWGRNNKETSIGRSLNPSSPTTPTKLAMPSGDGLPEQYKHEDYKLLNTYNDPELNKKYPHYPTNVAVFACPDEFTSMTFKWAMQMRISTGSSGSHISDSAGLIVSVKLWGCDDPNTQSNSHVVQTNNFIVRHEGSGFTYSDYTPIDTGSSSSTGDDRYYLPFAFNTNFHASRTKCGPYCYFTIDCAYTKADMGLGNEGYLYLKTSTSLDVNLSSGAFRTGAHFTLNDLWDNNYNVFEQILNYCKMYRILIFVDNASKQLKFIPAVKYFGSYTITDWTDKVDTSRDFTVTPMTFEDKYVLFNYKDSDSKLGKKYKEAWGVNYGEKKIITNYNFNQEEKKLFESEITPSITSTDNSLSWTNLYDNSKISYSLPAEIFPYAKDDSKKKTDNFGSFYFHNGKASFDTDSTLAMRSVKLSDDTTFQQSNNTYYYSQNFSSLSTSYYPRLDILNSDGEKLCIFNTPSENYTYAKNLSGTKGIYDMFWKLYINERYNIQNKLVTCYIRLTPKDFIEFDYNKFVMIDNYLYMVNKIYDYNVSSNLPTKVDLVSISDIESYYVDYFTDYLTITPDNLVIDTAVGSTGVINVNAYKNAWTFEICDEEGNIVNPSEYNYKFTLTNTNNSITITKSGDYLLDYYVRIKTKTREKVVHMTSAKSPYIRFFVNDKLVNPNSETTPITFANGKTTEFDVTIETNYYDFYILCDSVLQYQHPTTGVWKNTAYQAASFWDGSYNNDHKNLTSNIHMRITPSDSHGKFISVHCYPIDSTSSDTFINKYYYNTIAQSTLTLEFNTMNVDYHGATFGITGKSSSPWSWTLPSGVTIYGGQSGETGDISTTFNVLSGQENTTKRCVLRNDEGMQLTLTINLVPRYVSIYSNGELITDEYVEYQGQSSTRGYKVYATGPWVLTLPQGVSSSGPTSGTGNVSGGESITVNWGSADPGTIKSIIVSLTGIDEDVHQTVDCHYVTEGDLPSN